MSGVVAAHLVVDASVAVKWFLDEQGSVEARAMLASGMTLLAPELILAEVANVGWKAVRRSAMTAPQIVEAIATLRVALVRLVPLSDLAPAALRLALRRDHPAYDCFYVALAAREGLPLVTADARLAARFGDDVEIRLLYPSASA